MTSPSQMPPLQEALDYEALSLQPFYAGALVRYRGDFHCVADPLRCVARLTKVVPRGLLPLSLWPLLGRASRGIARPTRHVSLGSARCHCTAGT